MGVRIVLTLELFAMAIAQSSSSNAAHKTPVIIEEEPSPKSTPSENKRQSNSSPAAGPNQNQTTSQQKKRGHAAPPEHIEATQAVASSESESSSPERSEGTPDSWLQAYVIISGVLAFIGLCVLFIVHRQLSEMKVARKQTDALIKRAFEQSSMMREATEQTDRLIEQAIDQTNTATEQSRAANMAACAARTSSESFARIAGSSMQSFQLAQQAMQLEQRAWIFVTETRISELKTGKPLSIVLGFRNTGRTPARNVQIAAQIDPLPKGHAPEPNLEKSESRGIIPPNATLLLTISIEGNHQEGLTEQGLQAILSGDLVVWIYGTVHYEDVFETRQATMFCYMLQPDGRTFHASEIYNDAT